VLSTGEIEMNVIDYIKGLDLGIGNTLRTNCPVCDGVNTFTASNMAGELLWNCYKANCNTKGRLKVSMSANDIKQVLVSTRWDQLPVRQEHTGTNKEFVRPTYITNDKPPQLFQFCEMWGIDIEDVLYDVRDNRVVFPIYHDGKLVDAAGRAMSHRLPKWKRYNDSGLPYHSGSGTVGVLVEDCISAYVIGSDERVGVALLGTSLSELHTVFLSRFDKVIVALDPDALPKTLQIAGKLRSVIPDVRVLRLSDDLKYGKTVDLEELERLIWN
jgi:hypothetical protein